MAGTLPRPKRKSTKSTPLVAPEEVLYTDKDRSGDTLDLDPATLCPNPFNRREMKGVPELAATISEVGLLQNIAHIRAEVWLKTYPETADKITAPNVILFGEHRWRAIQQLGWKTIPSVLRDDKVEDARLVTLIENLRRAQLSPLEEAEHYHELRGSGLSYEQIAEKVGETAEGTISKGTVWKRVKLLDLAPEVQQALRDGRLNVSSAEKAQKLDGKDQRDYLALVLGGKRPAEAHAQILARQRQADDAPDDIPVSDGNADEAAAEAPSANREAVSNGNAAGGPPAQRKPKKRQVPEGDDESDRRSAAAARDAACRLLIETVDTADPENHELLLGVLTATMLAPQQQSAAQQRAFIWLREAKRHGLEVADAMAYFNAVQEFGDAALQRLAAFASGLAAAELRTAARRQSWSSREIHYVRVLQEHAEYEPQTEWEKKKLGLSTAGGTR
ncbi:ParB/RepB/Spo0J family partition protein [Streptomyces sp. AV19]|uniref:ParB/RepB/Spo0J family partition protein n=1 Tax=Streptomyces sp. AV19 TaxID=2793068 RepID=UPI0018FE5967|nr:ParB/RepB/Spo0J family partition protein [Streptomyces sp. AV19]MBH1937799.1 ParB/RepB/Spo0J family partition protein [Streptomyces sp. AV19]MDG4537075.1 ParB/RepB/Spo0J family partition protein [Streptomyces sp. AV19]